MADVHSVDVGSPTSITAGPEIVGRRDVLESVDTFLRDAGKGFAALVLRGPAGIGKTIVYRHAIAMAPVRGFRVLSAAPTSTETALSFGGLVDLFSGVLAEAAGVLPIPQRRALESALLMADHDASAHAIAAGCLGLVRHLARGRPVLLAIDDVQWLDPATTSTLAYVVRRLTGAAVGLLLTQRAEDDPLLPLGLQASDREGFAAGVPVPVAVVDLGPLSLGALHRLLGLRVGIPFPRPVVRRIHETSMGNAFVALELARSLRDQPTPPPVGPLPLPATLHDVIHARLATLELDIREELRVLAVAGELPMTQITQGDADWSGALDTAISAGFVELVDGRLRFAHPLYASTIYAGIPPFQRRAIHRRLAGTTADPEVRARHLALAADGPDREVADEVGHAAELARRRGAPSAAAVLAEFAAELTPPSESDRRRGRLLSAADCHMAAGNPTRAIAILDAQLDELLPGRERARVLLQRADASGDDVHEPRRRYEQAVQQAGGDLAIESAAHLGLATMSWLAGDFRAAATHSRSAIERAEQANDSVTLAMALAELAHAEANLSGRIPDIDMRRAIELEASVPEFPPFLRPSYRYGVLRARLGDLDEGRTFMLAELDRVRESGDEGSLAGVLVYLTDLERRAGNWDLAAAHLAEAITVARQASIEQEQQAVQARVALEAAHVGDADRCRQVVATSLPVAERAGWQLIALQLQGALGLLELSLGDAAAAHDRLAPATQVLMAMGVAELSQYAVVENDLEAMLALDDLDGAARLLDHLGPLARGADLPWLLAVVARGQAWLAAVNGDLAAAREAIDAALEQHDRLPDPFERARTQLLAGRIERRARQKRAAREPLEMAEATFIRLGAERWAERTRDELDRIGGRPAATGELTTAEAQVAELVASGMSNPEVAAALHVTRKTVEKHLSRVYTKLGVRSRVELTRHLLADVPTSPRR